jgi:hypothetical protein
MKNVVPVRPIIASGDDICFITYGQLGLESARLFIQYLQKESIQIKDNVHHFEACAGVAIVKHKFPFWLAYALADKLCANAKKRLQADSDIWSKRLPEEQKSFDTSLIDWHIVTGGDLQLNIDEFRQTIYQNKDGSYLLQRPYYLQRKGDRVWHDANYETSFLKAMQLIQDEIDHVNVTDSRDEPSHARSKWKTLREVYHQGELAVKLWQRQYRFDTGPNELFFQLHHDFKVYGPSHSDGDVHHLVAYFYDALEVMDYFIPLGEVQES